MAPLASPPSAQRRLQTTAIQAGTAVSAITALAGIGATLTSSRIRTVRRRTADAGGQQALAAEVAATVW